MRLSVCDEVVDLRGLVDVHVQRGWKTYQKNSDKKKDHLEGIEIQSHVVVTCSCQYTLKSR